MVLMRKFLAAMTAVAVVFGTMGYAPRNIVPDQGVISASAVGLDDHITDQETTDNEDTETTDAQTTDSESSYSEPENSSSEPDENLSSEPEPTSSIPDDSSSSNVEPSNSSMLDLTPRPEIYSNGDDEEVSFVKENGGALTLRIHRDTDDDLTFERFEGVVVDGKIVDKENYTVRKGSLIITFKPEFLKTLSEGKHEISIKFTDGEANFKVQVNDTEPEPKDSETTDDETTSDEETTPGEDETPMKGDANGDNKIDVTDIAVTAAHIKGIKALTDGQQKAADVNGDGNVDVTDIAMIASHIKGIKAIE